MTKRLASPATALALVLLASQPAFAQVGGGGQSFTTFLNNIANMMTGPLGQALAIVALCIAFVGMMFHGIEKRTFGAIILGIAGLFSSAWIVTQITGAS